MKRVQEVIKPFLSIILGALLLLYYLNWLSYQQMSLALGIVATVIAAYYLGIGIVSIILGDKLKGTTKKIFDIISISLFPTFMFVYFLRNVIDFNNGMGPTGWVIVITSMVVSISMAVIYIVYRCVNQSLLRKIALLVASIFVLTMLLDILFDIAGNPIVLGNIDIIGLTIYLVYFYMLVNALAKNE